MTLPGWRGTSETSLTLHGPPPGFCRRDVAGLDTVGVRTDRRVEFQRRHRAAIHVHCAFPS